MNNNDDERSKIEEESKLEREKLENEKREKETSENKRREEEQEKINSSVFPALLKMILKKATELALKFVAFTGGVIQTFIFGKSNTFSEDRNEISKFARDVRDANKFTEEAEKRNQEMEQKNQFYENREESQECRNKDYNTQDSKSQEKETPEKNKTIDRVQLVSDAMANSSKFIASSGWVIGVSQRQEDMRIVLAKDNGEAEIKDAWAISPTFIGDDTGIADMSELAKVVYSSKFIEKETVSVSEMDIMSVESAIVAAVITSHMNAAMAEGEYAKGSIQLSSGMTDFYINREMNNTSTINNLHIGDKTITLDKIDIKEQMAVRKIAQDVLDIGKIKSFDFNISDSEKIRITYKNGQDTFKASLVREDEEQDLGTFTAVESGKKNDLNAFAKAIREMPIKGDQGRFKMDPKAIAMTTAAFVKPGMEAVTGPLGGEIHMLTRGTFTSADDKKVPFIKTQECDENTPCIKLGIDDNGTYAFVGNTVRIDKGHTGEQVKVEISGQSPSEVAQHLSGALSALKRSSGIVEPEFVKRQQAFDIDDRIMESNHVLKADEQQMLIIEVARALRENVYEPPECTIESIDTEIEDHTYSEQEGNHEYNLEKEETSVLNGETVISLHEEAHADVLNDGPLDNMVGKTFTMNVNGKGAMFSVNEDGKVRLKIRGSENESYKNFKSDTLNHIFHETKDIGTLANELAKSKQKIFTREEAAAVACIIAAVSNPHLDHTAQENEMERFMEYYNIGGHAAYGVGENRMMDTTFVTERSGHVSISADDMNGRIYIESYMPQYNDDAGMYLMSHIGSYEIAPDQAEVIDLTSIYEGISSDISMIQESIEDGFETEDIEYTRIHDPEIICDEYDIGNEIDSYRYQHDEIEDDERIHEIDDDFNIII